MKKTTGLAVLAVVGVCAVLLARSEIFLSSLSHSDSDEPTPNLSAKGLHEAFPGDSKSVLDENDQIFLYSIKDDGEADENNKLQGHPIIGRLEIEDEKAKANLIKQFYNGVGKNVTPGDCFFPHHAIRAVKAEKTLDIIICFGCQNLKTYYDDQEGSTSISRDMEGYLNRILKKAKIAIDVAGADD